RDDALHASKAAALRELFEEMGVVLDGERARVPSSELKKATALETYQALGLKPDPNRLKPAGRWITPDSAPVRFDTPFFFVEVEEAIEPNPNPREFSWARFAHPNEILSGWERLTHLLAPPTRFALSIVAGGSNDLSQRLSSIPEATGKEPVVIEALAG